MANKSVITYIAPKEKFVMVSNSIVEKYDADVVGVYCKIVKLSSGKSLSIEFISKKINVSDRKVRKIVVFLENEGYIVREAMRDENGFLCGWNYFLYAEPVPVSKRSHAGKRKEKDSSVLPKTRQDGNPDKTEIPTSRESCKDNILSNTDVLSNNNEDFDFNKEEKLSKDNIKDDDFENFWIQYGKKGSKANALKEWKKLRVKDKELVEKNLSDYLIYCKRSKRSKKDACSYLHQEYYKQQWNQTPECYQEQPTDNERQIRFKNYMVSRFADLIYHRNPLTFEQATQLLEELGTEEFEKAMDKLSQQDIHQYYSINEGVRKVLEIENQEE